MTTTRNVFAAEDPLSKRRWQRLWVAALVLTALVLSAFAGVLYPRVSTLAAGREWLVLAATLVAWFLLLISVVKYDVMVFVAFCLFGVVRIEPAPVDLLLMVLLILGIGSGRLRAQTLRGSSLVHLLVWTYLIANLVSLLTGSAENIRFMLITFYMVAIFYFMKMYVASPEAMRVVMVGYLISALLSVGLLVLHYVGIGPDEFFVENNRAKALFKDANVFGPFLAPMIIFLIDEIWRPSMIRRFHVLKLLAVAALMAGLFLSFSRAAWGNLVLALAVYFALNLRRMSGKIIARSLLMALGGAILLALLVNSMGLQDFLRWRATAVQNYDFDRLAAQKEAIRQGFANLAGLGPGMMDIGFYSPHSLYARTFGEQGIPGFVALVLLIGVLMATAYSRAVRTVDRVFGLSPSVVFASAVGLLFNSFVIDTLHWRHYWFILALLWILASVPQTRSAAQSGNILVAPIASRSTSRLFGNHS